MSERLAGEIGLLAALRLQARVVVALMLREMHTRFGEAKAGYVWGVLEPMIHAFTLTLILSYFGHASPLGGSVEVFIATGVVTFFLFRDIETRIESALIANKALLFFPIVKPLDTILARYFLELLTWFSVTAIIFFVLYVMGHDTIPHDPIIVIEALLAMSLLGTGLGLFTAVINHYTVVWEKVLHVIMRPIYLMSGLFFLPSTLPDFAQKVVWFIPTAHGIDWVRTGFYEGYTSDFLSRTYLVGWGAGLLFLGLLLERITRKKMEIE